MSETLIGPTSHYFYLACGSGSTTSTGGMPDKPPLLLIHGGRDHARNWDWVALDLRARLPRHRARSPRPR